LIVLFVIIDAVAVLALGAPSVSGCVAHLDRGIWTAERNFIIAYVLLLKMGAYDILYLSKSYVVVRKLEYFHSMIMMKYEY